MSNSILHSIVENWTVWFVSAVLIVAAIIDGKILKVPNKLTFPFILSGLVYSTYAGGLYGLLASIVGGVVGMCLLLFLRNMGGMGAGDVKLLAGVGTWLHTTTTLWVFGWTGIVGGIMGLAMIAYSGNWFKHYAMAHQIVHEWKTIRRPSKLAAIARERKPSMLLLPYGIPMAVGAILYFAGAGLLV